MASHWNSEALGPAPDARRAVRERHVLSVTFGVRVAEAPIGSYALLARDVRQSRTNAVQRAVGVNDSNLARPVLRVMRIAEPVG
jgi:hypothetical protein